MPLPASLVALLRMQHGIVSVAQLDEHGITRSARRHALSRGWRLVLPGVLTTHPGPLSPQQRLVAAQLWGGDDALVAGATAAAVHGVRTADGEPLVRMLLPAERFVRPVSFVVVRRTRRPDPWPRRRGTLRLSSPVRAVADAARDTARADHASAVVIEAVQRRIVRAQDLRHELEDGPRQGSALLRRAVQAAEAGAWSVAEVDLARLLAPSTVLPPVMLNPVLTTADGEELPTPDGWLDDAGLAVQVHSRRHHFDVDDWETTVLSDGVYAEFGIPVVAMTPRFVRRDPAAARLRVERAYRAALTRPRADVTATPVGHGLVG